MPVALSGAGWPEGFQSQAEEIWQEARKERSVSDAKVLVQAVSAAEIRELNGKYRHKDKATNVLTFSYGEALPGMVGEESHEVLVCLEVARQEAKDRGISGNDYLLLLLVHGFLHAAGMDHERSEAQAKEMETSERRVLSKFNISSSLWG